MKKRFEENKIINGMNRIGNALLLNMIFIICSIPVITVGASLCAYYYAMIKSVRRERSYVLKEFFAEFKRGFVKSLLFTLAIAAFAFLIWFDREYFAYNGGQYAFVAVAVLDVLAIFLAFVTVWIFPVISRFQGTFKELLKRAYMISFKHILKTLLLGAGFAACIYLCLIFPVTFTLIFPPVFCYLSTYLIEPVFKKYIKEPSADEDGWYYDE